MKQIGKSFLGTVGVVIIIAVLFFTPWILSKIPITAFLDIVRKEWHGIVIGVAISYLGMMLTMVVGKKKE